MSSTSFFRYLNRFLSPSRKGPQRKQRFESTPLGLEAEVLENRTMLSGVADSDYFEDFEDGVANNFIRTNPSFWSIQQTGGNDYYKVAGTPTSGLQTTILHLGEPLTRSYDYSADIAAFTAVNQWQDGFLIFDYVSETDFKYAGFFSGQNQWVIGQWSGDFTDRLSELDLDDFGGDILPGRFYDVVLEVREDRAILKANGSVVGDVQFASGTDLSDGKLGLMTFNSIAHFDNVYVDLYDDQYEEDFDDLDPGLFDPTIPEYWSVIPTGASPTYQAGSTTPSGLQTALFGTQEVDVLPQFKISADILIDARPGLWQDGFIIFDYQSETDFKFAGTFAGFDQWVVGQYNGNFSQRFLQVNWQDQGKLIDPQVFYSLDVVINVNEVTLFVDGAEIGTAIFNVDDRLDEGAVGIANFNALTRFDNFAVYNYEPPALPPAILPDEEFEGSDLFELV